MAPSPPHRARLTRAVPSLGLGLALAATTVVAAPAAAAAAPVAPAAAGGLQPATPSTYVVKRGDSVWAIARRTGSSVSAIIAANGLRADALIHPGQKLTIPRPGSQAPRPSSRAAAPATPPPTTTHVVRAGESVWLIARRTGSSVGAIIAANGLDSRAVIHPGQKLTIPPKGAAAPTPARPLVGSTFLGRTYPSATVAAANANKAALLARSVPTRDEMKEIIRSTAVRLGVDPALALAVAHQESGFDQRAVSPANAIGAMQVIPTSGDWASGLVGRELDLLDPHDNAMAGVAILRQLRRSTSDLPTAIAGYYQGLGSVRRNGMYADTRRYVANIQTLMTRFR